MPTNSRNTRKLIHHENFNVFSIANKFTLASISCGFLLHNSLPQFQSSLKGSLFRVGGKAGEMRQTSRPLPAPEKCNELEVTEATSDHAEIQEVGNGGVEREQVGERKETLEDFTSDVSAKQDSRQKLANFAFKPL